MASQGVVMRGSLEEFSIFDVLQCVGVSRQHTVIELHNPDGSACGVISMKCGHVLGAQHRGRQGRHAFIGLLQDGPAIFTVSRVPDQEAYAAPLGPLASLIIEAMNRAAPKPATPPARKTAAKPAQTQRVSTETLRKHEKTPPRATKRPPLRSVAKEVRPSAIAVAIASPKGGVGKTTISLNLALSLAERQIRTTLIDGDVNGDMMSLIDARGKVTAGAYDFLDKPNRVTEALRETQSPYLKILPASGPTMPTAGLDHTDRSSAWSELIDSVGAVSDVVIIDCPAGMFHASRPLLISATHVLGVFQSELVAQRSFGMFLAGLEAIPKDVQPELLGIVVNMFNGRAESSLEAFHEICVAGDKHRLFETTIPRSDAFLRAALTGSPLRVSGDDEGASVAWLFDSLASEVCSRLGRQNTTKRPKPFMM